MNHFQHSQLRWSIILTQKNFSARHAWEETREENSHVLHTAHHSQHEINTDRRNTRRHNRHFTYDSLNRLLHDSFICRWFQNNDSMLCTTSGQNTSKRRDYLCRHVWTTQDHVNGVWFFTELQLLTFASECSYFSNKSSNVFIKK